MSSFNLFDLGRPSSERLLDRFGMRPPDLYVRFAQWCFDRANGEEREAQLLYWRLLTLESYDVDNKGYSSPFELFSIGDFDGDQVGWVVLAPEIELIDHPWLWYMHDGNSVRVVAPDTASFFTRTLSHAMVEQPENADLSQEAAVALGLQLSEDLGRRVAIFGASKYYETNEPPPRLAPSVPAGWRYLPSDPPDDGVGVLAPANEFAPVPHVLDRSMDHAEHAGELGNRGYSASALWFLLTGRSCGGNYSSKYLKQAYLNLDRPQIAARVDLFDA